MYKLMPNTIFGAASSVKRVADQAIIPFDPANTDYQAYLKWLEEGNMPIAADAAEPAKEQ